MLSFEERAKDLVSRMTLEQKTGQMLFNAPAINELGIPSYNWWNEALHGVARAGIATVFPQAIGLAAMFDEEFMQKVADAISTEGRAKFNSAFKHGDTDIYKGLTFWSPNVNIFRDPRWGRGHETFGEDPYLTARLGVAFIKGLQGDHEKYLKSAACAKHFAVHSGPESLRHEFDAKCSPKDLWETYLPAFEACVLEADVEGVMGAYNRTNGEPCCGSKTLLVDILRNKWGFNGYVTSDCWAIRDFHEHHKVTDTAVESVALAVNNTCDLNCGSLYGNLLIAIKDGLITEQTIDECVVRLMTTRMKLGLFDDPSDVPYASIPYEMNDCPEHNEIAYEAAKKSLVLLKNDGLLPLDASKLKSIAVIGPNAYSKTSLIGNYHGTASQYVTVLDGIREWTKEKGIRLYTSEGCHLYKVKTENLSGGKDRFSEVMACAENSDLVVMCLGLDESIEGEQGDTGNAYYSGDKPDLNLPGLQSELLKMVVDTGKPVVLVVLSGSALDLSYAEENVSAVVQAFYPGQQGGKAVADMLFGKFSPSGRLPVTFYKSTEELPDFCDYSMENRTYRFMKNEALYPFGFGLSYSKFEYSDIKVDKPEINKGDNVNVSFKLKNIGGCDADEIVQGYLKVCGGPIRLPKYELKNFKRVSLKAGEEIEISLTFDAKRMETVLDDGNRDVLVGQYKIFIGGMQPDERSKKYQTPLEIEFICR